LSRLTQVTVDGLFVNLIGPTDGRPVLLIHGSTETGHHDWFESSSVAHSLASEGFRVVAPDCAGHGRSVVERDAHGRVVYSFHRMAEQLVSLIRALNTAQRFDVIGHSNGGTVALFLARFFADAVNRVVCLAGNAYIDARIRDGVPVAMAPERIERERTEWRDDMVALHDRWHGSGYWKELVAATVQETITEPQWTASELVHCLTPVLAVQGETDGVNVPGQHAQTIATWFPHGESWLVPETGHSVHWERPELFHSRVLSFLRTGS
jgi:esterase